LGRWEGKRETEGRLITWKTGVKPYGGATLDRNAKKKLGGPTNEGREKALPAKKEK